MDTSLDRYAGKMAIVILCASAIMIAAGAAFFRSSYAVGFGLGVAVAAGLNIAKVYMLKLTVARVVGMESTQASSFTSLMYLARFVLTGLVLVLVQLVLVNLFSLEMALFGAAVGLLSMPVASYAIRFFVAREDKSNAVSGDTVTEDGPAEDAE